MAVFDDGRVQRGLPGLDPAELTWFLRPIMPGFMLPRFVDVVAELPRTEATLGVRKAELRARGRSASTWDAEAS
jgi:crotonobetaine/carnitine-CoA ligase